MSPQVTQITVTLDSLAAALTRVLVRVASMQVELLGLSYRRSDAECATADLLVRGTNQTIHQLRLRLDKLVDVKDVV